MIDTVNSVVSNASLLRQSAQQVASAETKPVSKVTAPPYLSLQISVNTDYDTAVIEIHDSDTGDVLKQFPNESTLQARQRAEAVRDRAEALRKQQAAPSSERVIKSEISRIQESRSSAQASGAVGTQATAIAQQAAAPQQSLGAGGAQVAIAALSVGAQSGQPSPSTVSVTA